MVDWKGCIAALFGTCKNFFWEAQFVTLGEFLLSWVIRWKWFLLFSSSVGFLLVSMINVVLIGFVPVTDGGYLFRDIRSSRSYDWNTFPHSQSHKWKSYITSYQTTNSDGDKLGSYEVVSASVFRHSHVNKRDASVIEPIENEFVVLLCRKKGKHDVYLTFEKVYGVPKMRIWKMFFGPAKKSGIHAQLSGNRNDALTSMNSESRPNLSVGKTMWRQKNGAKITVGRMLAYYTENSAYLSAGYHIYFSNSHHFADAVIDILQQMQDNDLGNEIKSMPDDFSFVHFLLNMATRLVL